VNEQPTIAETPANELVNDTPVYSQAELQALLAGVEAQASQAIFDNDMPDIRRVNAELQMNIRRTDRITKWLSQKFPDDWSDEYGG
jgi:hypothetical protein